MRRRRVPRLFRLAALLAILGMAFGWMEASVPDVHDGHGAVSETGFAIDLAHDHLPASPDAPGHAPQSSHTCHCVHAHTPALPARPDAQPGSSASSRVFSTSRALASVAPEPHFRPPVA